MRSTGAYRCRWIVAVLVLLAELGNQWMPAPSALAAGAQPVLFPETGFSLASPFLDYWQARGGLASYGYPITGQLVEGGLLVQYFERARFEYHPENAGTRYDVLLTALGTRLATSPAPRATMVSSGPTTPSNPRPRRSCWATDPRALSMCTHTL